MARHLTYDQATHPTRARELARQGMIDAEIAKGLGISLATYYRWQERNGEFREAIKEGKRKPNEEVEASLFKRAMGFEYTEVEAVPDGKGGQAVKRAVRKLIPADPACMIFWLKNRDPARWRDVRDIRTQVFQGDGYQGLSPEQAEQVEKEMVEIMPELFGAAAHRTGNGNGNGKG